MTKYLLYVLRWIVLAVPGALFFNKAKELLGLENVYMVMIISQSVMSAMVYFLDRMIFTSGVIPIHGKQTPAVFVPIAGVSENVTEWVDRNVVRLRARQTKRGLYAKIVP
jgi:hypothetical protein